MINNREYENMSQGMNKCLQNVPNGFLNEEIRLDYMVSAQMKKVWAIEIDLVQELLRVCDTYHLKCWMDGGTLLGAVRHKGFIPWDDDIDMIMFREDYDTLVNLAAKEFKSPYFLQTVYSDKSYTRTFARLRNINTAAIQVYGMDRTFNHGIFIDIFVLDGISSDLKYISRQEKQLGLLKRIMERIFNHKITKPKHLLFVPFIMLL
jgi:lipopolysaccharide cholinephosphotransferase